MLVERGFLCCFSAQCSMGQGRPKILLSMYEHWRMLAIYAWCVFLLKLKIIF